jgi:hypothetical protein
MLNTQNLPVKPTNNQMLPGGGGAKFVRVPLDFSTLGLVQVDMSSLVERGFITQVQTMYADNSQSTTALAVSFGNPVSQTIIVPPLTQGYYPILFPDPNVSAVSASGLSSAYIALINVPIPPMQWSTTQSNSVYDGNGNMKTADQNLAGAITNNLVQVQDLTLENLFQFNQNKVARQAIIAAGAVSALNLFQDNTFDSFSLDQFDISVTSDMSKAAAGLVTATLVQSASATNAASSPVPLWSRKFYVPAAAGNTPGVIEIGKKESMDYRNTTGGNAWLHLTLDNALTTGSVLINILGNMTTINS